MWNDKPELLKKYRDPDEIRNQELSELREAMEEGNQVEIRLTSLTRDDEGYCLIGKYGESGIDVLIPDTDWFPDLPTELVQLSPYDLTVISPNEWVKRKATASMDGIFYVLIVDEEEDTSEPLFYGSRIEALEEDRRETFFTGNPPQVEDQILVRVVNATARSVRVEAAGVECVIPRAELSWIFKADCQDAFPPGSVLKAVITRIEIHPNKTGTDGTVDMDLSIRQATPFFDASWKYDLGDRVTATVIAHIKNGLIADVAGETTCYVPLNEEYTRPMIGQKIIVEVIGTEINDDGIKRLSARIKTKLPLREIREKDVRDIGFNKKARKAYLDWLDMNHCVPIDLAYKYITSYYYYNLVSNKPNDRKLLFSEISADRLIASLRLQGLRNDVDGCHHAPRLRKTIWKDPKPDRLLRVSELYQIFRVFAEPEVKIVIPPVTSEVEVMTILRENGEVESVAIIPDGSDEDIQTWIDDLTGKICEGLDEITSKEVLNYWKKFQASECAKGVNQVILTDNLELVERVQKLGRGEGLLENSQAFILKEDTDLPGFLIDWEKVDNI